MYERFKAFDYYTDDCPVEWVYSEEYEIVVDMKTKEVICMLGEPEDRTFTRDLKSIIGLLNKFKGE